MRVFVYGSLKRGFGNHPLLRDSEFLGEAKTEPAFTMIGLGGFPGIMEGGDTSISGEVYAVDARTLQRLDDLEGHPHFYHRQNITVTLDGYGPMEVGVYVLPSGWTGSVITTGMWEGRG